MTKEEERHLDRVQQLGCIVCRQVDIYTPAEIHHILDGNRRIGHFDVLPLCFPHHRGGSDGSRDNFISRHPYKARFEQQYGPEAGLLIAGRRLLYERFGD